MNPLNIGTDAGMGSWKLVVRIPNTNEFESVEFLSQVASDGTERAATTLGLRVSKPPLTIKTHGRTLYVGARAHDFGRPVESLDYGRLTGSPEMIASFYGALTKLSEKLQKHDIDLTVPLKLTVGLPFGSVKGDDGKHNISAVRLWMQREHSWLADGQEYRVGVVDVGIATQTTGALFDYLLDDDAKFIPAHKPAFRGECGVISIGFNTIEAQVIRQKEEVSRFTTGATSGVRRLLDLSDPQHLYSLGESDSLLRAGKLDVTAVLPVWEREVTGFIEKAWGTQWQRFTVILLVGGGIRLLPHLSQRFDGKAFVPDNPVMSIARGLEKLGRL